MVFDTPKPLGEVRKLVFHVDGREYLDGDEEDGRTSFLTIPGGRSVQLSTQSLLPSPRWLFTKDCWMISGQIIAINMLG